VQVLEQEPHRLPVVNEGRWRHDQAIPGFAADETLLYAPELKFYSNRVCMDERFDTNIENLHCLGDASGWTRGLMMASVMGYLMGRCLAEAAL
jgi:uncharacterized FAD-dependent dehydrogenase